MKEIERPAIVKAAEDRVSIVTKLHQEIERGDKNNFQKALRIGQEQLSEGPAHWKRSDHPRRPNGFLRLK
jgi:hypothetical protein